MRPRAADKMSWPLHRWPENDQAAWVLGCAPSRRFSDIRYANGLRQTSLHKVSMGYGYWLRFLSNRDWLDPDKVALERVTRRRLRAWFYAMIDADLADATIIMRFHELAMALKIMAPGKDVSWVRRPDGATIYSLLPKRRRAVLVPDSAVLLEWALELMDTAETVIRPRERLATFRDGLLLAWFATRARRLRSMALLRVGHEVVLRDGRYWVDLTPEQVKTDKDDCFDLPDRLTRYMHHYLHVVRPALLGGRTLDALWISADGTAMSADVIANQVQRRSRRRFGTAFGPHRFRHALSTTAALHAPDAPGLAAGLLGISKEIVERNYRRTGQVKAVMSYAELIERKCREAAEPRR